MIFEEFQKEANHRREMEKKEVEINKMFVEESIKSERQGYKYAFYVTLICFPLAFVAILLGNYWLASLFGIIPITGLVKMFLPNKEPKEGPAKKEDQEK